MFPTFKAAKVELPPTAHVTRHKVCKRIISVGEARSESLRRHKQKELMKRCNNGILEDISEETIVHIASEIGIVPIVKLQGKYGVSRYCIQKIKAAYCRPSVSRKLDIDDLVRKYYPEMSSREMARRFGHSSVSYSRCAKALGVKHTEDFQMRIKSETQEKLNNVKKNPGFYGKISNSLRKTWKMERFRVMSGYKQKTGYKIRTEPKFYSSARSYLVTKRGYILSENDNRLFYYDDKTNRSKEDLYIRKYKFKFMKYENSTQ